MKHPITVDLEDYFQGLHGRYAVSRRHWDVLPSRLEANAARVLDMLERCDTKATFFADPWVAERFPGVLEAIVESGHEIGCRFDRVAATSFSDSIAQVGTGIGQELLGCRIDLDALADKSARAIVANAFHYECSLGDVFSSSVSPSPTVVPGIRLAGRQWSISSLLFRNATASGAARLATRWAKSEKPKVLSFKLWELDDALPQISTVTSVERWLCNRNQDDFARRLELLLKTVEFEPVRTVLGLSEARSKPLSATTNVPAKTVAGPNISIPALSIVVPCFNEEEGLPYLRRALAALAEEAGDRCRLSFILVDDGSNDGTWDLMERLFGSDDRFELHRHDVNKGVAAAMMTGIAAARSEAVAVMDSDCSYDPSRLWDMVPALGPGVALVTASPYHKDGAVQGVPEWRLWLSKGASALYRLVLRNKLATYTSCFRVYRRSAVERVSIRNDGFIGVAELLARLDLEGWRIAEHPTVLERRLFGRSKLKVLKTVTGHLRLLLELGLMRLKKGRRPQPNTLSRNDLERLP